MEKVSKCKTCGGTVRSFGGFNGEYIEWGGNCNRCGRGYGEAADEPPTFWYWLKCLFMGEKE